MREYTRTQPRRRRRVMRHCRKDLNSGSSLCAVCRISCDSAQGTVGQARGWRRQLCCLFVARHASDPIGWATATDPCGYEQSSARGPAPRTPEFGRVRLIRCMGSHSAGVWQVEIWESTKSRYPVHHLITVWHLRRHAPKPQSSTVMANRRLKLRDHDVGLLRDVDTVEEFTDL